MFELHPQLAADSLLIGEFKLSRLLLMNDSRYPWLILVPRRQAMTELFQLSTADQLQLWQESAVLGERLLQHTGADKLNIAALGNVVPQLHLHHVARFCNDSSWPAPVWGRGEAQPYTAEVAAKCIASYQHVFADMLGYGD